MKYIGVDVGSSKAMCVADDAEIILTATGSVSTPTLLCFHGRNRLVGEEALPQMLNENTVAYLNILLDQCDAVKGKELFGHFKLNCTPDQQGACGLRSLHIISYPSIMILYLP